MRRMGPAILISQSVPGPARKWLRLDRGRVVE